MAKDKISNDLKVENAVNVDYIVLNTDKLIKTDSAVNVSKVRSYFIPAIVFWTWNRTLECEINSRYFVNIFTEILNQKAEDFLLEKHLGGKTIEITLEKVPERFYYTDRGTFIYTFVDLVYFINEYVFVENQEFRFTYRILNDGIELKKDTFSYIFTERVNDYDYYAEPFIEKYIDDLKFGFQSKSHEFIERMIEDF